LCSGVLRAIPATVVVTTRALSEDGVDGAAGARFEVRVIIAVGNSKSPLPTPSESSSPLRCGGVSIPVLPSKEAASAAAARVFFLGVALPLFFRRLLRFRTDPSPDESLAKIVSRVMTVVLAGRRVASLIEGSEADKDVDEDEEG